LKAEAKKLYEAMFLVDSAQAASDWDGVITSIKTILKKANREIVSIRKWDERKLAYEVKGHSRGTYILCYFRANGEKIQDIERDVQLSERIMRVLILSADHMTQEDIEMASIPASAGTSVPLRKQGQKDGETGTQKDTAALQAEKPGQEIAQEAAQSTQAVVEKTESEQVGVQEAIEQAEELEQSAKPTADANVGDSEQPEQAEAKDYEPVDEQSREEA